MAGSSQTSTPRKNALQSSSQASYNGYTRTSQIELIPDFLDAMDNKENLEQILAVLNSRSLPQRPEEVLRDQPVQGAVNVDAKPLRRILNQPNCETAFVQKLLEIVPAPSQPGLLEPHHIVTETATSSLPQTDRNQVDWKPDGVGLEHGVMDASWATANFLCEISRQKDISRLSTSSTISSKYLNQLLNCSCILRERPLAARVFGFSFFQDIFTLVCFTREDILYFEVKDWSADENFHQVIQAINFLRYTSTSQLLGLPHPTATSWSVVSSDKTVVVSIGECFGAHYRNFGTASAAFRSNTEDVVVKAVWVNSKNLRSSAEGRPEPMELHVMRHIASELDASADREVLKCAACYPKLLVASSAAAHPEAANRSLWFIVMEGQGEIVNRESVHNIKEMVQLFDDIVQAVLVLNKLGIAHRDVSFSNFLVKRNAQNQLQPFIIDFGASSFIKPGECGEADSDPSRPKQDTVTMTPECASFAVCTAGRSTLYHFHPRQDLESVYYLLAWIMINLLLKPDKVQEQQRKKKNESHLKRVSSQGSDQSSSASRLTGDLDRMRVSLPRKAKHSASASTQLNDTRAKQSALADNLIATHSPRFSEQRRAAQQFSRFAVNAEENVSLFTRLEGQLGSPSRLAWTVTENIRKFLADLETCGDVIPSKTEKGYWRSLADTNTVTLVKNREHAVVDQNQAAAGRTGTGGDDLERRRQNRDRMALKAYEEGRMLVKGLNEQWLVSAEKLRALFRGLLGGLNKVTEESFDTWSEWDE